MIRSWATLGLALVGALTVLGAVGLGLLSVVVMDRLAQLGALSGVQVPTGFRGVLVLFVACVVASGLGSATLWLGIGRPPLRVGWLWTAPLGPLLLTGVALGLRPLIGVVSLYGALALAGLTLATAAGVAMAIASERSNTLAKASP